MVTVFAGGTYAVEAAQVEGPIKVKTREVYKSLAQPGNHHYILLMTKCLTIQNGILAADLPNLAKSPLDETSFEGDGVTWLELTNGAIYERLDQKGDGIAFFPWDEKIDYSEYWAANQYNKLKGFLAALIKNESYECETNVIPGIFDTINLKDPKSITLDDGTAYANVLEALKAFQDALSEIVPGQVDALLNSQNDLDFDVNGPENNNGLGDNVPGDNENLFDLPQNQ